MGQGLESGYLKLDNSVCYEMTNELEEQEFDEHNCVCVYLSANPEETKNVTLPAFSAVLVATATAQKAVFGGREALGGAAHVSRFGACKGLARVGV